MQVYREGKCRGVKELYDLRRTHEEHPAEVTHFVEKGAVVSRGGIARMREELAATPAVSSPPLPSIKERSDGKSGDALPIDAAPIVNKNGKQTARVGTRPARQGFSRLWLLVETDSGPATVLFDDLPVAGDEVFVVHDAGNRRAVKLRNLQAFRLRRD